MVPRLQELLDAWFGPKRSNYGWPRYRFVRKAKLEALKKRGGTTGWGCGEGDADLEELLGVFC
jgi:hypothetical protein